MLGVALYYIVIDIEIRFLLNCPRFLDSSNYFSQSLFF